jgi:hypothetical protein
MKSDLIQRLMVQNKTDTDTQLTKYANAAYPEELQLCHHTAFWKCRDEPHNRLDIIIPTDVVRKLEESSNTTMKRNLELQVIFIGGADEESCNRAIHSLDGVHNLFQVDDRDSNVTRKKC